MNKIYGPYKGKDNRWRIILINDDVKTTKSYPRFIVENYLGVELDPNEDIHHIDGNPDNNDISNLEIVWHTEHCRNHSIKYLKDKIFKCVYCGVEFVLTPKQQRTRTQENNRNKAGPFCSRSCSGKYGAEVQRATKLGNLD